MQGGGGGAEERVTAHPGCGPGGMVAVPKYTSERIINSMQINLNLDKQPTPAFHSLTCKVFKWVVS